MRKPKPTRDGRLHHGSKLSVKAVLFIRSQRGREVPTRILAKRYGVSYQTIYKVRWGDTYFRIKDEQESGKNKRGSK